MISLIPALDVRVLTMLYAMRDQGLVQLFIWISALGDATTIIGLALIIALVFLIRRRYAYAVGLTVSVATSSIVTVLLKEIVHRPRPPAPLFAYHETWWSFPSGHAALSFAFYGFLALLVWRSAASKTTRIATIIGISVLILLIGFTRLYLGVHYPSDVIAGFVVGAISIWLGVIAMRYFSHDTVR